MKSSTPMRNNIPKDSSHNVFQYRSHSSKLKRPLGGVRQDKRAESGARVASKQLGAVKEVQRAEHLYSFESHLQNKNEHKNKLIKLDLWVKPIVKAELQRIAKREGLSVSAAGAAIFEKALQQNIDMQYGALLEPIIKQEIRQQMRAYSSRIALLLVRVAFASEQTRNIVTNILARQPGVKPDILDHILDSSSDAAKSKITAKTPQLESIITEVEQWFTEKGGGRTQE